MAKKQIYVKISNCAHRRDLRILKEGIRYLLNLFIHGKRKKSILEYLCMLIDKGLESNDDDTLNLCLFALMIISENEDHHHYIFEHKSLLQNLASKSAVNIKSHAKFYSTFLMNLSLNHNNWETLLNYRFIPVLKDLFEEVTEDCHCYILTYVGHIIRFVEQII